MEGKLDFHPVEKEGRSLHTILNFQEKNRDLVRVDNFFGRQKKPNLAKIRRFPSPFP